jgi:hypothetical protein
MQSEDDRQGARDAAMVLPFIGAILLFPPVVLIFAAPSVVAGVPLILLYLFGVWGAIIAAAYVLARRLPGGEGAQPRETDDGRR